MSSLGQLLSSLQSPQVVWSFIKRKFKLLGLRKHRAYRKFIILARSRTGSNLLISYLNNHPAIIAETEIFRDLQGEKPEQILPKLFRSYPSRIKAVGFKIFYYHPLHTDGTALWKELVGMEDLHIIHLKRRNILRTLISRKIAKQKDKWASFDTESSTLEAIKSVRFEVSELEEGFQQTRQWEEEGDRIFQNHPLLTLYYEDLADSPDETFKKITAFLGLAYQSPKTYFQKQNPEKTSALLANYAELKQSFTGTPWSGFFED